MWKCHVCNRTMEAGNKESHLNGKPHARAQARKRQKRKRKKKLSWDPKKRRNNKEPEKPRRLHPNGQHLIRIRDVKKVHGHMCEIPYRYYLESDGKNSLVTPDDVDAASDQWDAVGIAHDIDTQWGMMPQGGAYKDSSRYAEVIPGMWIEI